MWHVLSPRSGGTRPLRRIGTRHAARGWPICLKMMSAWSRPRGVCGTRRAHGAVGRGRCAGPARGTQLCCCGVATAATWCMRGIGLSRADVVSVWNRPHYVCGHVRVWTRFAPAKSGPRAKPPRRTITRHARGTCLMRPAALCCYRCSAVGVPVSAIMLMPPVLLECCSIFVCSALSFGAA